MRGDKNCNVALCQHYRIIELIGAIWIVRTNCLLSAKIQIKADKTSGILASTWTHWIKGRVLSACLNLKCSTFLTFHLNLPSFTFNLLFCVLYSGTRGNKSASSFMWYCFTFLKSHYILSLFLRLNIPIFSNLSSYCLSSRFLINLVVLPWTCNSLNSF